MAPARATANDARPRSRVTVVCAECKRLKLKCDRRSPCGSCLKRGRVPRCTYTTLAAAKIDVPNLHNRLMSVEGELRRVSGVTGGTWMSNYPPVGAGVPEPTITQAQAQAQAQSQFQQHYQPLLSPSTAATPFVDALDLNLELDDADPSDTPTPTATLSSSSSTTTPLLPPSSIYIPHHASSSMQTPGPKPRIRVTQPLLALLPSLATSSTYLSAAVDVLAVSGLQLVLDFSRGSGWKGFERRVVALLRGAGAGDDADADADVDEGGQTPKESLPFFALVCAVLSLGALHDHSDSVDGEEDGETLRDAHFLFLLSQQSLELTACSGSCPSDVLDNTDALRACLVCVRVLLGLASGGGGVGGVCVGELEKKEDVNKAGKKLLQTLLTTARLLELDTEEGVVSRSVRERCSGSLGTERPGAELEEEEGEGDEQLQTWKRMLWWECVWGDVTLSDALHAHPVIVLTVYSTRLPLFAVGGFELAHGRGDYSGGDGKDGARDREGEQEEEDEDRLKKYVGARYRLAQLMHAIHAHVLSPPPWPWPFPYAPAMGGMSSTGTGTGTGAYTYTLDQACALDACVRGWLGSLCGFTSESFDGGEDEGKGERRWGMTQLALLGHSVILSIWVPFLSLPPRGRQSGLHHAHSHLAVKQCIQNAQDIVGVANGLSVSTYSSSSSTDACAPPVQMLYVGCVVLAWGVFCSAASSDETRSRSERREREGMIEDLKMGLGVALALGAGTGLGRSGALTRNQRRVLEVLRGRVEGAAEWNTSIHAQSPTTGYVGQNQNPNMGIEMVDAGMQPAQLHRGQPQAQSQIQTHARPAHPTANPRSHPYNRRGHPRDTYPYPSLPKDPFAFISESASESDSSRRSARPDVRHRLGRIHRHSIGGVVQVPTANTSPAAWKTLGRNLTREVPYRVTAFSGVGDATPTKPSNSSTNAGANADAGNPGLKSGFKIHKPLTNAGEGSSPANPRMTDLDKLLRRKDAGAGAGGTPGPPSVQGSVCLEALGQMKSKTRTPGEGVNESQMAGPVPSTSVSSMPFRGHAHGQTLVESPLPPEHASGPTTTISASGSSSASHLQVQQPHVQHQHQHQHYTQQTYQHQHQHQHEHDAYSSTGGQPIFAQQHQHQLRPQAPSFGAQAQAQAQTQTHTQGHSFSFDTEYGDGAVGISIYGTIGSLQVPFSRSAVNDSLSTSASHGYAPYWYSQQGHVQVDTQPSTQSQSHSSILSASGQSHTPAPAPGQKPGPEEGPSPVTYFPSPHVPYARAFEQNTMGTMGAISASTPGPPVFEKQRTSVYDAFTMPPPPQQQHHHNHQQQQHHHHQTACETHAWYDSESADGQQRMMLMDSECQWPSMGACAVPGLAQDSDYPWGG